MRINTAILKKVPGTMPGLMARMGMVVMAYARLGNKTMSKARAGAYNIHYTRTGKRTRVVTWAGAWKMTAAIK